MNPGRPAAVGHENELPLKFMFFFQKTRPDATSITTSPLSSALISRVFTLILYRSSPAFLLRFAKLLPPPPSSLSAGTLRKHCCNRPEISSEPLNIQELIDPPDFSIFISNIPVSVTRAIGTQSLVNPVPVEASLKPRIILETVPVLFEIAKAVAHGMGVFANDDRS